LFVVTSDVFAIPTLTEASTTGTTVKFETKLSEILPKGYKVKIDYGNSKGLVAMTCSGLSCSLSSNALPIGVSSANYKIGIYDAKGVLQGKTIDDSYVIKLLAYTDYTKISNSGEELLFTAKLGSGPRDWACTQDNKTGLMWEVKTNDGGLHDKDWTYSWYKPNSRDVGYTDVDKTYGEPNCVLYSCNTYDFTNTVNAYGLCGKKDWRMPTVYEIGTLSINKNLDYLPGIKDPDKTKSYWSSNSIDGYAREYDLQSLNGIVTVTGKVIVLDNYGYGPKNKGNYVLLVR